MVSELDRALVNFGMAIGPMHLGDLAGTEIGYLIRKEKGLVRDQITGLPGKNRRNGMRCTDSADDLVRKLGRVSDKRK